MRSVIKIVVCLPVLTGLLLACSPAPVSSPEALNESYRLALARTQDRTERYASGSVREREALAALSDYFAHMTGESVRQRTRLVYAEDAYLNDNLAFVEGVESIEAYFQAAAGRAETIEVKFEDVARAGSEYYIRWQMTIVSSNLNGGNPMVSLGMTHFRLDADGRVLLHKDFWDAGTGLYEYLPGLGGLLRAVRGRVAH